MGYSIQDSETGEVDYISRDLNSVQCQKFDEETGEPLNSTKVKVRYVKHKHFQIPKEYLRGTPCEEIEKKMKNVYEETYPEPGIIVTPIVGKKLQDDTKKKKKQYEREDFINMEGVKTEIILGYNKSNIHLFLIPTFVFFNVYMWLFLCIVESFLHFVAHRKNDLNMDKSFYYQSPLHVLTSQFCYYCRAKAEMEIHFSSLNKQMREMRAAKTLKDVTKAIS